MRSKRSPTAATPTATPGHRATSDGELNFDSLGDSLGHFEADFDVPEVDLNVAEI